MDHSALALKLQKKLQKLDPTITGHLLVQDIQGTVAIMGSMSSSLDLDATLETLVQESFPHALATIAVTNSRSTGLVVTAATEDEAYTAAPAEERTLDEVSVLFQGSMPVDLIQEHPGMKRLNDKTRRKVEAPLAIVGFVAPLVLDKNLRVIDGNLRLSLVRELIATGKRKDVTVPVIVINDAGPRAEFLRLVLNRSAEFQRWIYPDVDAFVDTHPQLQPILEPLGFFGERILPVTYFGATMVNYTIDPYNDQQQMYKQEIGLAKWAEIQRERIAAKEAAKRASRVKKPTDSMVSLFDLEPEESDFVPTHQVEEHLAEEVAHLKETAGKITENYDSVRRQEIEESGLDWQRSRRNTRQKARDKRAAAEARASGDNDAVDVDAPVVGIDDAAEGELQ